MESIMPNENMTIMILLFIANVMTTWIIGLIVPVTIRYGLYKKPMANTPALLTTIINVLLNAVVIAYISGANGISYKVKIVQLLIAYCSYDILRSKRPYFFKIRIKESNLSSKNTENQVDVLGNEDGCKVDEDIEYESVFKYPFRFIESKRKQTIFGALIFLVICAMVTFGIQVFVSYLYGLSVTEAELEMLKILSKEIYVENVIRSTFFLLFSDLKFIFPVVAVIFFIITFFRRIPLWANMVLFIIVGTVTYVGGVYLGIAILALSTLIKSNRIKAITTNERTSLKINSTIFLGISIMISSVIIASAIILSK